MIDLPELKTAFEEIIKEKQLSPISVLDEIGKEIVNVMNNFVKYYVKTDKITDSNDDELLTTLMIISKIKSKEGEGYPSKILVSIQFSHENPYPINKIIEYSLDNKNGTDINIINDIKDSDRLTEFIINKVIERKENIKRLIELI